MNPERLDQLLLRHLNAELEPQEAEELRAILQNDPHAAARLLELADEELLFREGFEMKKTAQKSPSGATATSVLEETAGALPSSGGESGRHADIHFGTGIHKFVKKEQGQEKRSSKRLLPLRTRGPLWPVALAACALVAVTLFVVFRGSGLSVVPPQEAVAKVVYVFQLTKEKGAGPTLVRGTGDKAQRTPLAQGQTLLPGDRIETSPSSSSSSEEGQGARTVLAAVELAKGATVELADQTTFAIESDNALHLEKGLLYADVNVGGSGGGKTEVSAQKSAAAESTGQGSSSLTFRTAYAKVEAERASFDLRSAPKEAVVQVEAGALTFKNATGERSLKSLQKSVALKDAAPSPAAGIQASALWRGRKEAADVVLAQINFQPASAPAPAGYQKDDGSVYSSTRGYGWDSDQTANAIRRGAHKDLRLDTYVHIKGKTPGTWKYDLPNGNYLISLASGDAKWGKGPARITVEGTIVVNDVATTGGKFTTVTDVPITVTDGQLTVQVMNLGVEEAALNYLIIKKAPAK